MDNDWYGEQEVCPGYPTCPEISVQEDKLSNLPTGSQTDNYLTFGLETNFITILTGPLSHLKI